MDVYEAIKKRRSIRKFKWVSVEQDKIAQVLDAGHAAPSAGNLQSWRFIIVKDKKKRSEIARWAYNQLWVSTAPVLIVVCAEVERIKKHYGIRGERLYCIQECAAVAQNMMLCAEDLGLATCWVGAFDEPMVKRVLEVPDSSRPQIIIAVGYAGEKVPTPMKQELRTITYFEKYGEGKSKKEFFPLSQHIDRLKSMFGSKGKGFGLLDKLKIRH